MSEGARPRQISVIGSGDCEEGSEAWGLAEDVGRLLAEAGAVVVCGGLGGVMEAAPGVVPAESAREAVELVFRAL